jgi:hypothetical protein
MKTDQAVVRVAHLTVTLGCSEMTLDKHIRLGNVPAPDMRGLGNAKLWKLETIRAWHPALADTIEHLLTLPAFQPRPVHTSADFPKAA